MHGSIPDDPIRSYDLVVVGASAGGIEALATLVASLPADFAAPMVIAQHLDPDHQSHLGDILARRTPLTVRTVTEQEPLISGVIYVVPADRDVEITDHEVHLLRDSERRPKPSVNHLFSSAALAHGERLVGVILTGAGSDGATGARDVKAAGGMVIIENPATAAYASMPQALAPSTVDLIVDLPQIGPLLAALVSGAYTPSPTEAEVSLPALLAHVRERSGIDFSSYKTATILRRLQRRLAATSTRTIDDYQRYLTGHHDEYQRLIASFLIKVTEFFRDPKLFAALRDDVLPHLLAHAREHGEQVRCWSAGCATGEEAYSLAILFAEALGDSFELDSVRIFATDLDADAITFARRGIYPAAAVAEIPPDIVARSFISVDGAFEVAARLRGLVIFGQHDLGQRAPFPQIDLVLCRNVLIYFTTELQRRALQLFAFALRDGGYLALGKAETPSPLPAYFAPVAPQLTLYRRQGARIVVPPIHMTSQSIPAHVTSFPTRNFLGKGDAAMPSPRQPSTIEKVGALILGLPVGIIVVDKHYDIQAINAAAQRLLGIFRAASGEDLIHIATSVPSVPLRAAIDTAFQRATSLAEVVVETAVGERKYLQIAAYPQAGDSAADTVDHVLLLVTDVTARVQAQQAADEELREKEEVTARATRDRQESASRKQRGADVELRRLREENARLATQLDQVAAINHDLVSANQEMTSANLALLSANEDILIRNEELQAATEEIKTLNEELQATNEELETLNEEMEATVEELRTTNDDLSARTVEVQQMAALRETQRQASEVKAAEQAAIMLSMGDALLVLDQTGAIRFTNAAYVALFGGPTADFVAEDENGVPLPDDQMPQRQAAKGVPFRKTFTLPAPDGSQRWLEATGEPIEVEGTPIGGVVTFRDITDRSLRRLQDEFLALASHELRNPLTAIQISAQFIERKLPAITVDDRIPQLLHTIRQQATTLQRLIDELMDVGRLQYGKLHLALAPVELRAVVEQTAEIVALTMPKPPIVLEAGADPLPILGDAMRLEQIVTNLLTNAGKYAGASERIVVRLRRVEGEAEVQVQDTGPGIPADVLPYLFQRFYQAAQAAALVRHGLGLGLFIARELVVAHGGDIQVASEVGQGTTFTMRFPLLSAVADVSPAKPDETAHDHTERQQRDAIARDGQWPG